MLTRRDFAASVRVDGRTRRRRDVDPQGEMGVRSSLLVPDGRHVLCGHAGGLVPHDCTSHVQPLLSVRRSGATRGRMQRMHAEAKPPARPACDGRYRPTVTRCVSFGEVPAAPIAELNDRRVVVRGLTNRAGLP
jgi:hypothetical protein